MIALEEFFSYRSSKAKDVLCGMEENLPAGSELSEQSAIEVTLETLDTALTSGVDLLKLVFPRPNLGHAQRDKDTILFMRQTFIAGLVTPANWGGHTPMSLKGFWVRAYCQGGTASSDPKVLMRNLVYRLQMSSDIERARSLPERDFLFVMPGAGQNGFFHMLMNGLPALQFYKTLKLDCPILLPRYPDALKKIAEEAVGTVLDSFSIPKSCLISAAEAAASSWRWAIMPNRGDVSANSVDFHHKHVLPAARGEGVGERVYISRLKAKRRPIVNENEIIKFVERHGFHTIEMEGMSFAEQVGAFRKAKTIVGSHGAGLTHEIYAPSGASIVEIAQIEGRNDFKTLAGICGHEFQRIFAQPHEERRRHYEFCDFELLDGYLSAAR